MFLTLNSLGMVLFTQAVPTCPKTKPPVIFIVIPPKEMW
jgi:hypothetical protein